MASRLRLLTVLERGASVLRGVGLGSMVDRIGSRIAPTVGTFDIEIDGFRLHGDHIGQLYYVRELLESDREATFVALLKSAISLGMTVVEAGAHLGYVTLQASRAVGPSGHVFAFEANPRAVPLLERNLTANALNERVTVVPMALADVPGRHAFFLSGGGDTSSLHEPEGASEQIEVTMTALDGWLDPTVRVDVVKLDIEGGEPAALRGMRETLERAGPDLVVFAECNPSMLERSGSSINELIEILREQGLDVRWIDESQGSTRPLDDMDLSHGYVNLHCRRGGSRP
jgi:FkbM family methyltransferase